MLITVGFLTARKFSWNILQWPRIILSNLIGLLQGKYVHTFLLFKNNSKIFVREMDRQGVMFTSWEDYNKFYKNRITILNIPIHSIDHYFDYNYWCLSDKSKYEYRNLLIWQLIYKLTGKWIGKSTNYRRICSEDSARGINIAFPRLIKEPDKISPNDLYDILNKYLNGNS